MVKFDASLLINNPFTVTLVVPATRIINGKQLVPNEDGVFLPHVVTIDKQSHTKVFHSKDNLSAVLNLSDCAKAMYLYIIYSLDAGKDYIPIEILPYMKKTGVKSRKTVNKAIAELKRYIFIMETEFDNVYWINPTYFFCGNRVNKYPHKVQIAQTWEK